jgi:hypothetical protein
MCGGSWDAVGADEMVNAISPRCAFPSIHGCDSQRHSMGAIVPVGLSVPVGRQIRGYDTCMALCTEIPRYGCRGNRAVE